MIETPVLIAGAGPVGLTLSLELARHGIECLTVERNHSTTNYPKMDITNGRSMELFRRLGVSEAIRAAAVPESHNLDVSWVTNMSGHEIYRFQYPPPAEARAIARQANDGTHSLEPDLRISQIVVEPVLRDQALACSTVSMRYGWALESFKQDADGVLATLRKTGSDETEAVRCQYLAGCDGGNSLVRDTLGIKQSGNPQVRDRYTIHFRSDATDVLQRWGIAWHYQSPVYGTLISQNGDDNWTLHAHSNLSPEKDGDSVDPKALLFEFLGQEIDCEILRANWWVAKLLVADSYGSGRVWLAGDSAHQFIPTGGYGMNTGIGDAVGLGWMMAATLQGWGGAEMLPAYEAERRPVGLHNRQGSARHTETRLKIGKVWSDALDDPGDEGDRLRAKTAQKVQKLGNAENESRGIELGYRYETSPVIAHMTTKAPPENDLHYYPVAWPGARAPSVFLSDGTALFDLFGPGFTLIDFGQSHTTRDIFQDAANLMNLPLKMLPIQDSHAQSIYGQDLILVRPDQHVAWCGDTPPGDVTALLNLVRGA